MNYWNLSDDFYYVLALCGIFTGLCLLVSGVYLLVILPLQSKRRLRRRFQGSRDEKFTRGQFFKAPQESHKGPLLTIVEYLTGWGKIENLQRSMFQADLMWDPTTFLSIVGILACCGFLLGFLRDSMMTLNFGLALLLGTLPFLYVRLRKQRKVNRLEKQMPDAMEMLARSLRAGHTLPAAIDLLSQEMGYPLGTEMRLAFEEQRLGLGLAKALRRMGERTASQDLKYFVTAVIIQTETGGNLAEVMENIGQIVRDRLKLKSKVKALTAEGRFSALILLLLPIFVLCILSFLNKEYISPLWQQSQGMKLLVAGGVSMIIGALWMRKMVIIKV